MRTLARLFRLRLSVANGLAAVAGYLLFPGGIWGSAAFGGFLGVTILAAGCSALNQVLERDLDRLMARTESRPLPSGEVTPTFACWIGFCCCMTGTAILATAGGAAPTLLGLLAVCWYLGVYTPLKRKTAFAVVSGAACGAVPPVIGWCLAGGGPADYRILLPAGLLYMWQVPHFWLLQYRHREEYIRAGLPVAVIRDSAGFLATLRLWLTAVTIGSLLLPGFGILPHPATWLYATLVLPLLYITSSPTFTRSGSKSRVAIQTSRHSSRTHESSSPSSSLT